MANLKFIENLKKALDELEEVTSKLDTLTLKKNDLRDKIRSWMEMHNLTEFESYNTAKDKLWGMSISKRYRKNINKNVLRTKVTEAEYDEIVTESEYVVFNCKSIKQSKINSATPAAPKGV